MGNDTTQKTKRTFARANLLRTCYALVVYVAHLLWTCYGVVANLFVTIIDRHQNVSQNTPNSLTLFQDYKSDPNKNTPVQPIAGKMASECIRDTTWVITTVNHSMNRRKRWCYIIWAVIQNNCENSSQAE